MTNPLDDAVNELARRKGETPNEPVTPPQTWDTGDQVINNPDSGPTFTGWQD